MITVIDLIRNLTLLLEKKFTGIQVQDRDITEGFDRPSFFIDYLDDKASSMAQYFNDTYEMVIYYFASNRYKGWLELLKVQSKLRYIAQDEYSLDNIEEFHFWMEDVNFYVDKKDKVLKMSFRIRLVQEDDRPDLTPEMEELDLDIREEE